MRRELPALRARRVEDAIKLVGIDKQRSPGVRVSLAVQLAAERSVGHALIGGADRLPAIESHFESGETEPLVTQIGRPFRSVDLFFDLSRWAVRR